MILTQIHPANTLPSPVTPFTQPQPGANLGDSQTVPIHAQPPISVALADAQPGKPWTVPCTPLPPVSLPERAQPTVHLGATWTVLLTPATLASNHTGDSQHQDMPVSPSLSLQPGKTIRHTQSMQETLLNKAHPSRLGEFD